MSSKDIIKRLKREGFEVVGQKGSHVKLRHPDGRTTIVPHPKKDLPPGTVHGISGQSGVKF